MPKIGQMTGATGYTIIQTMFASFTMIFYTTVFGINPAVIGTMMFVARVWDAINDPMMGAIIDKTNTKWGKARPYIIGGAVPLGLFLIMVFTAPQMSNTGKIIWAYVGYIGLGMAMTVVQTGMFTLMPRITKNPQEIVSLNTWYMVGANGAAIVVGLLLIPLLTYFSGPEGNTAAGYQKMAILFALVSIVCFWILGFGTKEKITVSEEGQKPPKITFAQMWKSVAKNDQLLIMCIIGLAGGLFSGIQQGSNVMYITFNLKDPNILTRMMPLSSAAAIIGTVITPKLVEKFGKEKTLYVSIVLGAIFAGARIITHDSNVDVMIILNTASLFFMSIYSVMFIPLLTDTIEYGVWKTGERLEGIVMTAYTFQGKFGLGLGGAIIGWALSSSGFVETAAEQSEAVQNVLFHGAVTSNFISFASLFVLLFFCYKLNDKRMTEIRADLAEGKSFENKAE